MKLNIAVSAAVLAAAMGGPVVAQDKPQLAFVVNAASDFWKLAEAGVKKAQEELPDYDLQFRYPAQGTAALQNALMDDLVAAGTDAIMISSADPKNSIDAFNHAHPEEKRRIDPRTEEALTRYAWPGNVRELKHAVERACILSPGPLLGADAFFGEGLDAGANQPPPSRPLADYLMDCERDYLRMVLEQHGGHITHTAEALGITRKTLWEKMRRLGLQAREGL